MLAERKMKILLIEPLISSDCKFGSINIRKQIQRSAFTFPFTLPYVAALIGGKVDIAHEFYDDLEDDFDLQSYDLVGIYSQTTHVERAIKIAELCKQLGIRTVVGGPATIEEGHRYLDVFARWFDSIVIGESEGIWECLLNDLKTNNLKKIYQNVRSASIANLPFPRYELVAWKYYREPYVIPIMSSRGCPRRCSFCSEHLYGSWRLRPVDSVLDEIRFVTNEWKIHKLAFRDDNFLAGGNHTISLLENLRDNKLEWSCQTDLSLSKNIKLFELAVRAGLRSISFGLESLNLSNRKGFSKDIFDLQMVKDLLLYLYDNNVETQLNVIYGFDSDTLEIFDETVEFILSCKCSLYFPSILYPILGTTIYDYLKSQNRILSDISPDIQNILAVNFCPKNMSIDDLVSGYINSKNHFNHKKDYMVNYWLGDDQNIWGT
jgi:radical SAM superfamily enzyme YgiQ (UPF0313 family)